MGEFKKKDELLDVLYQHPKIMNIKLKARKLFDNDNLMRLDSGQLAKLDDMFRE